MSPCFDAQEAADNRQCAGRLTQVTQLLCDLLKDLNMAPDMYLGLHPELREWWEEHKDADEKRK